MKLCKAVDAVVLLVFAAGCAASPPPASRPAARVLSPDSAALLAEALRHVQPAFATQREALEARIYAGTPPVRVANELPPVRDLPASSGSFVVQIAAYRDAPSAQAAASAASLRFPSLSVNVEPAGDFFRVSLGSWITADEALAALRVVRDLYPDAWLRRAPVP